MFDCAAFFQRAGMACVKDNQEKTAGEEKLQGLFEGGYGRFGPGDHPLVTAG